MAGDCRGGRLFDRLASTYIRAGVLLLTVPALLILGPAPASEAVLTTEAARSLWRTYALDSLAHMEYQETLAVCTAKRTTNCDSTNHQAWLFASQASLTAFKYESQGGWSHPEVQALLDKVYSEKKPAGGYGEDVRWDAFGEERSEKLPAGSSTNPASTVYTVDVSDHVGEPLIEGYDAGVVPRSELEYIADALWKQPLVTTPDGVCVAYSDQGEPGIQAYPDDQDYCVVNVSAGAAACLQRLLDRGILPAGETTGSVAARINELKTFIVASYEKGGGKSGDYVRPGFWPYLYDLRQKRYESSPQDWNHNAFTAQSAQTIGLPMADDAIDKMLDQVDYSIRSGASFANNTREIQGRLMAQTLKPDYKPQNTLAEALYFKDKTPTVWKPNTVHAQGGMWAMRLALTGTAESAEYRPVEFITTPRLYRVGNEAAGPVRRARINRRYVVRATVRWNGTSDFVTNIPTELRRHGVVRARKPTGFDTAGVRYVVTVRTRGRPCFTVAVNIPGEQNLSSRCSRVRFVR